MKLHLPVLLRKAVLACFSVAFAYSMSSGSTAAADLTLGGDDSLAVDCADPSSITDLAGGTLTLAGGTELRISNCGTGDGKTYTLLTSVSGLLDDEGNVISLDSSNNAIANYFDTTQPGTGFWADATLSLTDDGILQLVLHDQTGQGALSITTRQVPSSDLNYSYYGKITAQDRSAGGYAAYGGAIYARYLEVSFNNNAELVFSKNIASAYRISGYSDSTTNAYGGAIFALDIILENNHTVLFSQNSAIAEGFTEYGSGGAIYVPSGGCIKVCNNYEVLFEENRVELKRNGNGGETVGGAIGCLGEVLIEGNDMVRFTENYVYSPKEYRGAGSWDASVYGGGIYGDSVLIKNNSQVAFSLNVAEVKETIHIKAAGSSIFAKNNLVLEGNEVLSFFDNVVYAADLEDNGGAICAGQSINISDNDTIEFENNSIIGTGCGAACNASEVYITKNEEVNFFGNYIDSKRSGTSCSEAYGGAIKANNLLINDNKRVVFEGNCTTALEPNQYSKGGAIYVLGSLSICNNKSVYFDCNFESSSDNDFLIMRSLYAYKLEEGKYASLSAPNNGVIEFRDSIYINGDLALNEEYTTADDVEIPQIGDIVISSLYTDDTLYRLKGNKEGSESELLNSKTSEVIGVTHLYDGRLRVEDGAIFEAKGGIQLHSSVTGKSTPTLYLRNSSLRGSTLLLEQGTLLELTGKNTATFTTFQLDDSGSVTFHMNGENADFAVLRLSGAFEQQGALTLNISFNDSDAEAGLYKLLTVTSIADDTLWTSSNVTVNGLDGYVVSFDDLEWKDNTLYLNYNGTPGTGGATTPTLLIATWTNEVQDGLWNGTSLNWEQEEVDYAYKDGVQVVFGDEGTGPVTLVGDIAPGSVLVDSAEDYAWNADTTEGGKLTGSMSLTKKGTGTLSINTENDYTGGTTIQGGTVVAGTATALGSGAVSLTDATLKIDAEGVENALTTAGTSSILVQDDGSLALQSAITNASTGILTLSGKVDVSGIGELTKLDATLIDVNGNAGTSGFARTEGYTLQVVQGGKVLASDAQLEHSGLPTGLTLVLGENGLATAGATTDFTKYVVTGSHAVSVSEILKDVPQDSSLSSIEMSGGTLLVDAATDALAATGGTVTLSSDVKLGGTMSGGMLMAQAGEIAATLSGNTSVVVSGGVTLSGSNTHSGGVMLNGGALTLKHAQALGSGPLVTSGTSSLVIDSGVELSLGRAISNSGSLSISGKIQATGALNTEAATRVDVNGNSGASGFAKDALEWVQIVNGGTTVNAGAEISHNSATNALVLGGDGRAIGGGVVHYDKYLLTGTGVADVQGIKDAAGAELASIEMQGGMLTVNADTGALLSAEDGIILLTDGGKIGSGSSVSGVDIKASGGSIAATLNGSITLEGIGNFSLDAVIANNGTLVLSGNIKADALSLVEETPSAFVDVNGNSGTSGFAKSALVSVQLTSGTGTTIDGGVTLTHKDATETLVLGKDGKAGYGGVINYTNYLLDGEYDCASVSDIIADAGDALTGITVQKGTLTVDAVSKHITATGGSVVLDGGVLNGTLADTDLTLKKGTLGTASISGGTVAGVDYALGSVLSVSGTVGVSGSFNASLLQLVSTDATRIDVNGASGASGFLKAEAHSVLVFNGGTLDVASGTTVKHGGIDLLLGSNGYATAGGGITWSEYLLTGEDSAAASAIYQKAIDEGYNGAVSINQTGGTLTVTADAEVTTTSGRINLTGGSLSGSISDAAITATGGSLAATLSGSNTLTGSNYTLSSMIVNNGTLVLIGSIKADALSLYTEDATHIDVNGNSGASGFSQSALESVQLTSGTGSTVDGGVTITHSGASGDLVLGTDGSASRGGEIDYTNYLLNGSGDSASVSDIIADAGDALTGITVQQGTLTVDAVSKPITATGGSVVLDGGVLNGTLADTALTLKKGTLGTASISGGTVAGVDYALGSVLSVSGTVGVSGSFNASLLHLVSTDATRIDVNDNSGASGFLKAEAHSVQVFKGGTLDIASGTSVKHGGIDLLLGNDGYATAGGGITWSEYLLTGDDSATASAIYRKAIDEGYNGAVSITQTGGTLTVSADAEVTTTSGLINLTGGMLTGAISGATLSVSGGTMAAALTGNNTLVGNGYTLNSKLNNSGTLTLSGTFTVDRLTTNEAATYIGADGESGFAKDAYKVATIATGTTADAGATITYNGEELKLNTDGTASAGGTVHYDTFWLKSDVEVESDAIHALGANALVDITDGKLTVKDETRVKANGGSIVLDGGVLNGSLASTELTLKAGTVNATITDGKVTGDAYALSEILQVSGNVSISGSFVADALTLTTIDAERVDVVSGNSGNSGFLLSGGHSVQIINGGTLSIDAGTSVTHGGINLTLGADGYATTERTQGHEYLLIGNDTVNVGAILGADNSATIKMQGGTLTVDAATNALTATAGTINLNTNVELGGTISGATINASAGTLAATLNGTNTLVGDGYTLNDKLTNRGMLTLSGTFTIGTGLTVQHTAAGYESLSGDYDTTNGFARTEWYSVDIADGVTADANATITYDGKTLKLGNDGVATRGGEVDYTMYYLNSGELSTKSLHDQVAGADITLKGGTLTVETQSTVTATGGAIKLVENGVLNGSLTNTNLTLTAGVVNAGISGGSITGDSYMLNEILQVNGDVSISGSFNASALQLVTEGATRVDVVTGNSGNSGFLKQGDSYVQLINGGVLTIDGVTVSHQDAATTLILGNDGYARSTGGTNYGEYLLTGSDRVSTQQIHFGAGAGASVRQEGGMLTVNDATTVKTTSGEIVLSDATLRGEVSDARVTAEGGCIAATLGGITAVTITGEVSMSGNNSHSGVTTLADGNLTITHAQAMGSGDIVSTGASKLVVDGVTLVLGDTITNTGTLALSGSIDASALQLNKTEAGRLSLSGERVGLTESGFSQGVEYTVQIVDGGTTVNNGVSISHKDYLSRTQLVLGADGVARAGAEVDYTHFFLTGGDAAVVNKIAEVSARNQAELNGVTMDSGTLEVDQSMTVNATGGSIIITKAATLSGTIEDAAVSTAAGDYASEISALLKGDTLLEVNGGTITVSGDNSYSDGTTVNGGTLLAGNAKAFGTGDVTVNDATLDLNQFSIANKVIMNGSSTLGYADGASHIVLGGGAAVNFRDGYTQGRGKVLSVSGGGATYTGSLTLGGGTLELDGLLTVQGDVVFTAGTQTTLDVSGWKGLDDGDVLVDFGSSTSGYTDESLTLAGMAGDWELEFDATTGMLTLVEVKDTPLPEPEFTPELNGNQQIVYDTIKDIMGEGNPGGLLGELGKEVTGTRDEAKLKQLLDELGGAEYATLLSGQQAAARGHMGRLRGKMGSGYMLAGEKTRAYIEAYHHRSELDGDADGRGYELNESGGQFALEFLGQDGVSGGISVAAGRSKLQPEGGMTQKSDNTYVDAFMMHRDGAYTAKFSLGLGLHKYDLDRRVAGNAVSADAGGSSVNFMHESSWALQLDEVNSVQFFGAVESTFSKLGAFTEDGADTASLQVEGQDAWVTTLSLGARYLYSFAVVSGAPAATLSLQAGVEFDLGDTDGEVEMSFEGASRHSFRQSSAGRDTFGYNLGASLHLPVSDRAAVYAGGDAVLRGDSYEVNANAGLQMAF